MPGKYSHSVVLADYSARGIISLPPDQVSRYLESAPVTPKGAVTQSRLRGTQSAQAIRRRSPTRGLVWASQSGQRLVIPEGPPVPAKDWKHIVAHDEADDSEQFRPMRYSRYYAQTSDGAPVIGVISHVSQPELNTAYKRQQQANANLDSLPSLKNAKHQHTQPSKDPRESSSQRAPIARNTSVNGQLAGATATMTRAQSKQSLTLDTGNADRNGTSSRPAKGRQSPKEMLRPSVTAPYRVANLSADRASPSKSRSVSVSNENRLISAKNLSISFHQVPHGAQSPGLPKIVSKTAHDVDRAPIASPRTPLLVEPDFDGFSDIDFSPTEYSDMRGEPTLQDSRLDSSVPYPTERPGSSDQPTSRGQQTDGTERTTTRTNTLVQNGDVSSPSRTIDSSVVTSTRAQRSDSSASSVSVGNSHAISGASKYSFEGSRKASQGVSKLDQQWRLPEISEDHGFSPSMFEDNEGHLDNMVLHELDYKPKIGQISSGKDVMLDNSDAMSELSAALPPPITRFRDEEDEFNANMARLFGQGGDHAISKKANHSVGRSASKKTMGFFSKFRSRSSPPVKLKEG